MPQKLPFKTFLKSFSLAPRAAVSLLIKDKNENVLLTKRLKSPFANHWHLPGSFLIKNETTDECIKRILKEELGVDLQFVCHAEFISASKKIPKRVRDDTKRVLYKLLGVFENLDKDPRGHVIDIIYGLTLNNAFVLKPIGYTKEIKFFQKLPRNIGFNHKDTLIRLGYK